MPLSKLFAKKAIIAEAAARKPTHKIYSPQDIFELKRTLHTATKNLTAHDWERNFKMSDLKGKGSLSYAEFRRAVRRANIKVTAISDENLQHIVKMVDADGSGFIELEEFLSFLTPEHVPDILCRASTWGSEDRRPEFAANGIGLSVTEDGQLLHTGEIDGAAWNTELDVEGSDVWIEFGFPKVYFISHIILWNFMSWYPATRQDDSYSALTEFDVSYSLDREHWFYMGRVRDLPRVPTTGIPQYTGECIQNANLGGKDGMPAKHTKSSLVQLEENFLGVPTKFLRFTNLENASVRSDGNMYGINGVYFYGPEAVGNCTRSNMKLDQVPREVFTTFQYVLELDLSHNNITELPMELVKLVLLTHFNMSYNYLPEFPKVLLEPSAAFSNILEALDLSHNLLKAIPPKIGRFIGLRVLNLAGNFWGIGGLPDEMGGLINLRVFDLQGIPSANTFLWDDEARARHGLSTAGESNRGVINQEEFLAYVAEFPILVHTFGLLGAKAMFHRYDSEKSVTLDKDYVAELDLNEALALDDMILACLQGPFCGVPEGVWELDALTDLRLLRSGIETYKYPGSMPSIPASAATQMVSGSASLGIFTMLEEQARCFKGAIAVSIPNMVGILESEKTEREQIAREMYEEPVVHFRGSATAEQIAESLKTNSLQLDRWANPALPVDLPVRYKDFTGRYTESGAAATTAYRPTFEYMRPSQ